MRTRKLPSEAERMAIVSQLIASRHFNGIWMKGVYLYARHELAEDPHLVQWEEARRIVEAHQLAKKPPSRATGAPGTALGRRRG